MRKILIVLLLVQVLTRKVDGENVKKVDNDENAYFIEEHYGSRPTYEWKKVDTVKEVQDGWIREVVHRKTFFKKVQKCKPQIVTVVKPVYHTNYVFRHKEAGEEPKPTSETVMKKKCHEVWVPFTVEEVVGDDQGTKGDKDETKKDETKKEETKKDETKKKENKDPIFWNVVQNKDKTQTFTDYFKNINDHISQERKKIPAKTQLYMKTFWENSESYNLGQWSSFFTEFSQEFKKQIENWSDESLYQFYINLFYSGKQSVQIKKVANMTTKEIREKLSNSNWFKNVKTTRQFKVKWQRIRYALDRSTFNWSYWTSKFIRMRTSYQECETGGENKVLEFTDCNASYPKQALNYKQILNIKSKDSLMIDQTKWNKNLQWNNPKQVNGFYFYSIMYNTEESDDISLKIEHNNSKCTINIGLAPCKIKLGPFELKKK